jgi:hypothetical protein
VEWRRGAGGVFVLARGDGGAEFYRALRALSKAGHGEEEIFFLRGQELSNCRGLTADFFDFLINPAGILPFMSGSPQFGVPPTNLDFEKSLMFFHAYMYGPLQGKLRIYGARTVHIGSVAMSSDWEVFASMLVNDLGNKFGTGTDLANNEVKSARRGSGYEYQYHRLTGKEKLATDTEKGHLFFDYFDNLRQVDLRYLHASELVQFFEKWLHEYPDPYPKNGRYRPEIPYDFVKKNGHLLMTLKDGEVVFPTLAFEAAPVSIETEESEPDQPED